MTPDEYLDPAKFPASTQEGLTILQQMRIDAVNYDQLREFIDEGGTMDAKQEAIWQEFQVKIPAQKSIKLELK